MRAALLIALSMAGHALAHVDAASLSVKGGESFTAGQKVTVSWSAALNNDHNRSSWTLWLSKNNGTDWETIQAGIPGATSNTKISYEWTVPSSATTQAKLRVHQSGYSGAGTPNATGNAYTIVSGAFAITGTTSIAPQAAQTAAPVSMAREGEFIQVRFHASDARQAAIEVYDLSGALQKTLDLAAVKAGENQLKVSTQELGLTGKSVLRLRVGNRVVLEELISAK